MMEAKMEEQFNEAKTARDELRGRIGKLSGLRRHSRRYRQEFHRGIVVHGFDGKRNKLVETST